ncbi:efflux RND transporter periplasmic adaptor subunit [Thalassotalea ponticola]|uniref:efflux RND transporter periplasmic adaptor subunit n=1 Tax=Thalassotalea ponticola TaxID=1523392 RepID=UPI0025B626EB|nr:efflux RND transporter periplasmic adaptor subunit [Thalassotalea ponticola]MDN3653229.1 efflux RND transporter periplasmic adaptor subunit [Thalassotalea ponticola]
MFDVTPTKVHSTVTLSNTKKAILLILPWLWLTACSESAPEPKDNASYYHRVSAMPLVISDEYQITRQFIGKVVSNQQAQLNFEVAGRVKSIDVDEGDKVSKDQLLARLDNDRLLIERAQLDAQKQQFIAQIELNQATLKRVKALRKNDYASIQTIDELTAQDKVLKAQLQHIDAQLAANTYQLEHSELRAPFSGTLNKRYINMGEVITPEKTALLLNQDQHLQVKVGVPQMVAEQLAQINDPANSFDNQYPINIRLQVNDRDVAINGINISSNISSDSRSVQLRIPLDENVKAYHNQLAYLYYQQQYQQIGYWIPMSALTDGVRGTWNIFTLEKHKDALFKVHQHSVEVIHSEADRAFVKAQLPDDQLLVAAGLHRIVPGQLVRINRSDVSTQGDSL